MTNLWLPPPPTKSKIKIVALIGVKRNFDILFMFNTGCAKIRYKYALRRKIVIKSAVY
jgi:hypothetical protein